VVVTPAKSSHLWTNIGDSVVFCRVAARDGEDLGSVVVHMVAAGANGNPSGRVVMDLVVVAAAYGDRIGESESAGSVVVDRVVITEWEWRGFAKIDVDPSL
jgi:hypothetical protein